MKLYTSILAALPLCAAAFAPSAHQASRTSTSLAFEAKNTESRVEKNNGLNSLATAELPEKLYFPKEKEFPKILGGIKIGLRKICVVTGASSGLGLNAAATLAKTGRHFVVMAVRDVEKGKRGESSL